MSQSIREPARDVPVMDTYDVVVCGGGPAGCAAAIGASRHGARTLLVERDGYLGGTAVSSLVNVILSTNGVDFQGVWHEWATELRSLGGIAPLHREERMGTHWLAGSVAPEMVKLAWDRLLTAAGADILHFALAAGAVVQEGCIRGVIVETKGGRQAILAARVVDCTGDADICAAAGAGFETGVQGKPWTQGVALNALCGGMEAPADYVPGTLGTVGRSAGPVPLHQLGLFRFLRVDPLNARDLTRVVRDGRRISWERVVERRTRLGLADIPPIDELCRGPFTAQTATLPGIRASRRVTGMARMTAGDAFELRKYPDGIARASWEIDLHEAETPSGKSFDYRGAKIDMEHPDYKPRQRRTEAGDWFDVRYGALVAQDIDHLLMAGRCVSADIVAQASLRIQQTCMAMGQAAGVAAALSLEAKCAPRDLDPAPLVAQLSRDRDVPPAFAIEPA